MREMPLPRYELHREIEDTHWWFLARRRIIIDLLTRYIPPQKGFTVVEVGCGTGGNLVQLNKYYRAVGTEISEFAADVARKRTGCPVFLGDGLDGLIGMEGDIKGVLLLDLLEHLKDTVGFLATLSSSVAAGTLLLVTVPAGQCIFSEHDLAFGHLRRYNRSRLQKELAQSGFEISYISYYNSLLCLPAIIIRLLRKLILPLRKGARYRTDFWFPPPPFNRMFEGIMGAERFLLRRCTLPFGLSLIALAEKKGMPEE
ncbi:MAG: class I SAM-dependent methyltransferase [Candidatus Aureabacteria bacterium]|nr:class I SAM-dependent methyltransferase [Candidatus Auribacterota bacterium]